MHSSVPYCKREEVKLQTLGKKIPQVPPPPPLILRNVDNFPSEAFYLTPPPLPPPPIYTNSCYVFSFLHNFKLKAEGIID